MNSAFIKREKTMKKTYKSIELFAGAGGLALGLEQLFLNILD